MTVTAKVYSGISVSHQNVAVGGTGDFESAANLTPISYPAGSGSGQVQNEFCQQRTLAASASDSLDLSGGGLVDGLGNALTFANVKAIEVEADAGNGANIVIGAAGSNPFLGPLGGTTPTIALPAGGRFLVAHPGAGWTVTNSSNDMLKIANSDGANQAKYTIKIIGG